MEGEEAVKRNPEGLEGKEGFRHRGSEEASNTNAKW